MMMLFLSWHIFLEEVSSIKGPLGASATSYITMIALTQGFIRTLSSFLVGLHQVAFVLELWGTSPLYLVPFYLALSVMFSTVTELLHLTLSWLYFISDSAYVSLFLMSKWIWLLKNRAHVVSSGGPKTLLLQVSWFLELMVLICGLWDPNLTSHPSPPLFIWGKFVHQISCWRFTFIISIVQAVRSTLVKKHI